MPRGNRQPKNALTPDTVSFLDRLLGGFEAQGRVGAAFGEAARWGYIDYLKKQLDRGLAADTPTESGGTALMYAASGGQLPTMQFLLDAGANVNAQDKEKAMTPLMWCLASMQPRKVYLAGCRLLLERGADPRIVAADGKDAFWWANDRDNKEELCALLTEFATADGSGA